MVRSAKQRHPKRQAPEIRAGRTVVADGQRWRILEVRKDPGAPDRVVLKRDAQGRSDYAIDNVSRSVVTKKLKTGEWELE
jgi:hypothetical protein